MSIVAELRGAGEVLSPAVTATLDLLAEQARLLEERARLQDECIGLLEEENRALKERVRELDARLSLNSTNSSKPPSSDPPGTARPKKKRKSGRRRGGQRGHKGAYRSLLPPERVDEVVEHRPDRCRRCRHSLDGASEVGVRGRHQVTELPPVRAHVTEHQTLTLACPNCGQHTRAPLPAELSRCHFGPSLVAFGGVLLSHFRLSRRKLTELLGDLLDVPPPALGTTQAFADEVRRALATPYREAVRAVRRSRVVGADETGWKLRGMRRVLWVGVGKRATIFRLGRSRSARDRRRLLGRDHPGILTTDRWRAYDEHTASRRQLCWAHLKRNWEGVADAGGPAAPLATEALAFCQTLFGAWKEYSEGRVTHAELRTTLIPHQGPFWALLERTIECEDKRARALGRDLLRLWPALWTFLEYEGVPVTNNAAEQALRGAVIWRKTSFGSNSGKGLRFTERMLTVTETCRRNHASILNYLTQAIVAHRQNQPAPRLLPVG